MKCPKCGSPNVEAGNYIGKCLNCHLVFLVEDGKPYEIQPLEPKPGRPL